MKAKELPRLTLSYVHETQRRFDVSFLDLLGVLCGLGKMHRNGEKQLVQRHIRAIMMHSSTGAWRIHNT